jgi:hypothetical protein
MAATQRINERQQGFFSVFADAQTYKNLLFFFLVVPLGFLHAVLIALGFVVILGIAALSFQLPFPLSILCLSLIVPALAIGLVVIWWLLDIQSRVNQRMLTTSPVASPRSDLHRSNAITWCRERLFDRWTWSGLLYLLVITFLGALAAAATSLFIALSVALVAGSLSGDLGSVQMTLGSVDLNIPGLRLMMLPFAPLVATVGLHLANVLAGFAGRIGHVLLGPRVPGA